MTAATLKRIGLSALLFALGFWAGCAFAGFTIGAGWV
jgi:hypothetical protein